jgi:hypothetical protein
MAFVPEKKTLKEAREAAARMGYKSMQEAAESPAIKRDATGFSGLNPAGEKWMIDQKNAEKEAAANPPRRAQD